MNELSRREYDAILRSDLGCFAERCFAQLNPQAAFKMNWHIDVIAAMLTAVRDGKIRRLIINLPPRHLKSLLQKVAQVGLDAQVSSRPGNNHLLDPPLSQLQHNIVRRCAIDFVRTRDDRVARLKIRLEPLWPIRS